MFTAHGWSPTTHMPYEQRCRSSCEVRPAQYSDDAVNAPPSACRCANNACLHLLPGLHHVGAQLLTRLLCPLPGSGPRAPVCGCQLRAGPNPAADSSIPTCRNIRPNNTTARSRKQQRQQLSRPVKHIRLEHWISSASTPTVGATLIADFRLSAAYYKWVTLLCKWRQSTVVATACRLHDGSG
jgi:hypothetical protein